jgi:hypothetical protein
MLNIDSAEKAVGSMNGWRGVACGSLGVASNAPPRSIVETGFFSEIEYLDLTL